MDKINNVKTLKYLNYEDIDLYDLGNDICKIIIKNIISKKTLINNVKDFLVEISSEYGNVDIIDYTINCTYIDFLKEMHNKYSQYYIFHNIKKDINMKPIMEKLIPLPYSIKLIDYLRISRLYTGAKHTGCHLHKHSSACNYLISGKKIWVIFPNLPINNNYVYQNNWVYPLKSNELPKNWLKENYVNLKENILDLKIFVQYAGEVVFIPTNYFHAVVNLEDVYGITYSWYD